MPDKLEQLMLNRPVNVTGDVKYPKMGDPGVVDDKVMRGIGTAFGIDKQQPGDLPSALGAALGAVSMIPPGMAKLRGAETIAHLKDNKVFPEHVIEALEMAQKRWPRLFGHTSEILPMTAGAKPGPGPLPVGTSNPSVVDTETLRELYPGMKKDTGLISYMKLNADKIKDKNTAAQVIGHEMLHGADAIVDPESIDKYLFANDLPGGYHANSQEIRARLQGARTEGYMQGRPRRSFDVTTTLDGTGREIIPRTNPNAGVRSVVNDVIGGKKIPISTPDTPEPSMATKLFDLLLNRK
jgi:hypothetical protein